MGQPVPETGKVAVKKLWQTIDVGTVVNPSGAMAQAEGAALWGPRGHRLF